MSVVIVIFPPHTAHRSKGICIQFIAKRNASHTRGKILTQDQKSIPVPTVILQQTIFTLSEGTWTTFIHKPLSKMILQTLRLPGISSVPQLRIYRQLSCQWGNTDNWADRLIHSFIGHLSNVHHFIVLILKCFQKLFSKGF